MLVHELVHELSIILTSVTEHKTIYIKFKEGNEIV